MVTLKQLKAMAVKQGLSPSGTKPMIAKRLLNLRRRYLTKAQIAKLEPLVKRRRLLKKTRRPKKRVIKPVEQMLRNL
jgi:hypothetical protein